MGWSPLIFAVLLIEEWTVVALPNGSTCVESILFVGLDCLVQVVQEIVPSLVLEEALVELVDQPILMLVPNVLVDELWRPERLLTDLAAVLLAFLHLPCLIDAIDILHFYEDLVVLWILQFLLGSLGQDLLSSVQILQLKLPGRGKEWRSFEFSAVEGFRGLGAQMLGSHLGSEGSFILTPDTAVEAEAMDFA